MAAEQLKRYYRVQSLFYDATRWSFLFGRKQSVQEVKKLTGDREDLNILEIGCGTGANLENLVAAYPRSSVYGIDLSEDMLRKARKKLPPLPLRSRMNPTDKAYFQTENSISSPVFILYPCLTMPKICFPS